MAQRFAWMKDGQRISAMKVPKRHEYKRRLVARDSSRVLNLNGLLPSTSEHSAEPGKLETSH
eukprot:SAG22_NODE_3_length_48349_cov_158.681180_14_plen_62_part_00